MVIFHWQQPSNVVTLESYTVYEVLTQFYKITLKLYYVTLARTCETDVFEVVTVIML